MHTIGIRVAPTGVVFAVYDSEAQAIESVEQIIIPAAFEVPDALKYVRSNLLDILREYRISRAGIRAAEPNARNPSILRIEIEGVIKEAFASSELETFYVGHISSIAAKLSLRRTELKPMIEGVTDPGVENWGALSSVEREAILCAMGAVNA